MKIYFLLNYQETKQKVSFEHCLICLAEGFQHMNDVTCYANYDYWPLDEQETKFLFNHDKEISFKDCDVVIFGQNVLTSGDINTFAAEGLLSPNRAFKTIMVDSADGIKTPGFRKDMRSVDMILKTHFCQRFSYPTNFRPWQFGLSNRILKALDNNNIDDKNDDLLINFRVRHMLRDKAKKHVLPIVSHHFSRNETTDKFTCESSSKLDQAYFLLTGGRHNPLYYERLIQSKGCFAFGGTLQRSLFYNNKYFNKLYDLFMSTLSPMSYDRISQFDSWRLWESLVGRCVTFHVDFIKYGIVLPVMPENYKHYIGVDFERLDDLSDKIDHLDMDKIAKNGRSWAIEHYSPLPTAQRLMNMLETF